ncbi:hypothetical protein FB451DRAFT_1520400 [Mycena latifolia]|nr:hypothetical protein FB451DRAFT_1520400 [Mycena latifolia]
MLCASCKHPLPLSDALPTSSQTAQLQNLLRSSHFPPDPSHYHTQISLSTAALAQYDTEIERVQQTLRGMLTDRSKLQAYVDACRGVLSPVRRLPPELLCEIFSSYSESPPEEEDVEEREMKSLSKWDMLLLSQVCAQWRAIVMETLKFWSDIVVCGNRWSENPTRPLHLLRTSLERGARHPLTLSMDLSDVPDSIVHIALDLVVEHCERWQSVSFFVDMDITVLQRMRQIRGRLGMLERLEFHFLLSEMDGVVDDTDLAVFENAPRLHHVHFGNLDLPPCPKLPWKQLRSFIYQYYGDEDIAASLALLRNVCPETTFELRDFDPWGLDLPLALPPLTAKVFSFRIAPCTRRDPHEAVQALGDLLNSLTLPQLCEFSIDRMPNQLRNAIYWPLNQFESLAMRSSFRDTLRSLELRHVIVTEGELFGFLASLASLERLVIADQHNIYRHPDHILITDALLLGLTRTPNSPDFCLVPRLKYFACTSLFKFSAHAYLDLIASRVGPSRPPFHGVLRHFSDTSSELDPVVLHQLLELTGKGQLIFQLEEESCIEDTIRSSVIMALSARRTRC